ncbi:PREDICTED: uncharacterized protein LOC109206670 [Nicotiana attenuata]|uniref:Uncharacterized protein n=1 Tax=Nicotiana attenuata TaxID=49451 RepID=A0A314KUI1_NICAT|nr:PREDICTED: uncharacterized protein LOC109206670 [Nicotiana attenuata]OIT32922.1 hypothetical protein A4A49_41300 [Nicotiana attenuata]
MMETPSSTRRVTRSQVLSASNKMNKESENKEVTKSRSALIDLTNSPIVGLASGILETPSSALSRSTKGRKCCTPGSGEAILRCQVKNLLQMVEEEAEISLAKRQPLFHVKGVVIAPANTPLMDLPGNEMLPPVTASPVHDNFVISQIMNEMFEVKKEESSSNITRSLLLDFTEKSEEDDEGVVDELCEAISKINVNEGERRMEKKVGKHTRFVYNSDDEFEGVEECVEFAGLSAPRGKHLHFPEDIE